MTRTRVALGDALAALIDHRGKTPKKLGGDWADDGHRVVSAINIKDGRVNDNDHRYISGDLYTKWMRVHLEAGDVLLTSEAPTGEVAYLAERHNWALGQRLFGLRGKPDLLDGRYLFYALRGGDVRHQMISRATGTTVSGIRQSELVKVALDLPPVEEQRAIAAILGALDDKIESNRRAQAVGQGLIRATVQSSLIEGATKIGRVDDYCGLVRDQVSAELLDADDNYIGLDHMPRGSVFLNFWGSAGGLGSHKSRFASGDILFGKLRPYFRKVGIAPVDGVCSTDILVLRPYSIADTALVAMIASSDGLIKDVSAAATGTRMPRASWHDIASWPVPWLSPDVRRELGARIQPLIERLTRLAHEDVALAALRDALLPELLSGRVRAPRAAA